MSEMINQKNFTVSQEKFDGPFEALVSLIEKRKVHISEISLADIADEFVAYVKEREMQLKDVSDFVVVAATLMLLKSRSLLPQLPLSTEEEQDVTELQERLEMYSLFQKAGERLREIFGTGILYKKIVRKKRQVVFSPDPTVDVSIFHATAKNLIRAVPIKEEKPERKVEKQRSLKEITQDIRDRISRYVNMTFADLSAGKDRKETAASFLAVLELFRQGSVLLNQDETFGSIAVSSAQAEVPYYEGSDN